MKRSERTLQAYCKWALRPKRAPRPLQCGRHNAVIRTSRMHTAQGRIEIRLLSDGRERKERKGVLLLASMGTTLIELRESRCKLGIKRTTANHHAEPLGRSRRGCRSQVRAFCAVDSPQ